MKLKYFLLITLTITLFSSCSTYRFKNRNDVPELEGTTWVFTSKDKTYTVTFEKNGKLSSTHPNDNTPNNDTWVQDGMVLRFYFNNKYSTYTGKFVKANLIKGTATSKAGKWTWNIRKK